MLLTLLQPSSALWWERFRAGLLSTCVLSDKKTNLDRQKGKCQGPHFLQSFSPCPLWWHGSKENYRHEVLYGEDLMPSGHQRDANGVPQWSMTIHIHLGHWAMLV